MHATLINFMPHLLNIDGKSSEVYVVIPGNQLIKQPNAKWALGAMTDSDTVKIDEITGVAWRGHFLKKSCKWQ